MRGGGIGKSETGWGVRSEACLPPPQQTERRYVMILSEEQREEFEKVARPLIKWLNDNCHPHVTVIADCSHAELSEGVNSFRTEDYWKD